MLVVEYLSGVLVDLMSWKNLFFVFNVFLIVSFLFVFFFDSFIFMFLVWGLYGLYSVCFSGMIEVLFIIGIKENKKDLFWFLVKNN